MVGIEVVAGATAVVVTNSGDDTAGAPPAVSSTTQPAVLTVDIEERTETFDTFGFRGQYVRVSGLGDPTVEERVNAELAAPVDAGSPSSPASPASSRWS